ncbi:hypothetical protein H696_03683 [Fonticula alba]|uniref:Uncharacterized protein n=1 Tax=Fonticula alba TaxID=691883 RepID=A0A058Z4Q2_FONAL|nr:hypothetical protein H696_03683 [Fonticula alba]KCV69255.1 hypothetical protein H696_03683 [Fonticula alba]|eukprot:XP_009495820.1 hypothetical protein H696_03683 [Fonticula alba]
MTAAKRLLKVLGISGAFVLGALIFLQMTLQQGGVRVGPSAATHMHGPPMPGGSGVTLDDIVRGRPGASVGPGPGAPQSQPHGGPSTSDTLYFGAHRYGSNRAAELQREMQYTAGFLRDSAAKPYHIQRPESHPVPPGGLVSEGDRLLDLDGLVGDPLDQDFDLPGGGRLFMDSEDPSNAPLIPEPTGGTPSPSSPTGESSEHAVLPNPGTGGQAQDIGLSPIAYGPLIPHFVYQPFPEALRRGEPLYEAHRGTSTLYHPTPRNLRNYPVEAGSNVGISLRRIHEDYCMGDPLEADSCQQYLALVPRADSSLGHYFFEIHSMVILAKKNNVTPLAHPIMPAGLTSPEMYELDRFFGLAEGEADPQRALNVKHYGDICLAGFRGKECRSFLPCLEVVGASVDPHAANAVERTLADHRRECGAVLHLTGPADGLLLDSSEGRERAYLRGLGWEEFRQRFRAARRRWPISVQFDRHSASSKETLFVAFHLRALRPQESVDQIKSGENPLIGGLVRLIEHVQAELHLANVPGLPVKYYVFSEAPAVRLSPPLLPFSGTPSEKTQGQMCAFEWGPYLLTLWMYTRVGVGVIAVAIAAVLWS